MQRPRSTGLARGSALSVALVHVGVSFAAAVVALPLVGEQAVERVTVRDAIGPFPVDRSLCLHELDGHRVLWSTDDGEMTWTVVDQLDTTGGVDENSTFNRLSTRISVPLKPMAWRLGDPAHCRAHAMGPCIYAYGHGGRAPRPLDSGGRHSAGSPDRVTGRGTRHDRAVRGRENCPCSDAASNAAAGWAS